MEFYEMQIMNTPSAYQNIVLGMSHDS